MTDEKLEQIKQFFNNYANLEEFIEKYINIKKPSNQEALIQLFNDTKSNPDVWELAKFQRSTDTLRLDKLMSQNVRVEDILNLSQKYDLGKYKRIIIKLDNKNYEDIDRLSNLPLDIYIKVSGDKGICTLDEFKKMRDFFNYFIDKYSTYQLSNLEKTTLAYDYIKFFTFNKEQNDKLTDSRSIAKSISTGNMVCEGYSRIFCQLLREMGISSNLVFIEPNEKEKGGHVRVILNINDEKYNVNDVFAFDPTWDSNQNMSLITHSDGSTGYEIESWLKQDDTIVEKLPSDIRYLFYMVPIHEYSKYFSNEKIEKIEKYPSGELIELTDQLMTVLNYDDHKPKDDFVFDFIQKLLYKVKKVEGYKDEQIEKYIHHAIEIMKQDRYGRHDKYKKKRDDSKNKTSNMDIIYHNERTGTSEKVVDITKISKEDVPLAIKEFAEGSSSLEKCLQTIYNTGIVTRACCKGNHIEVNENSQGSIVNINSDAYIVFEKNSDWKSYLSPQLIKDEFVVIEDDCIRHYGENHDEFFEMLTQNFMTEKKDNISLIDEKKSSYSRDMIDELEQKSYLFSLSKNGFSKEQISNLLLLKLKIKNVWHDDTLSDLDVIRINNELGKEYNIKLQQYFNENLQQTTRTKSTTKISYEEEKHQQELASMLQDNIVQEKDSNIKIK